MALAGLLTVIVIDASSGAAPCRSSGKEPARTVFAWKTISTTKKNLIRSLTRVLYFFNGGFLQCHKGLNLINSFYLQRNSIIIARKNLYWSTPCSTYTHKTTRLWVFPNLATLSYYIFLCTDCANIYYSNISISYISATLLKLLKCRLTATPNSDNRLADAIQTVAY